MEHLLELMDGRTPSQRTQTVAPETVLHPRRFLPPGLSDPLVLQAVEFIEDGIDQALGVDDLATLLGVNRRSLERAFRHHLQRSVLQVVQHLRIRRACQLLDLSDRPVRGIAEAVGFGSIDRFMACFKRETGMTAREWRSRTINTIEGTPGKAAHSTVFQVTKSISSARVR
jgi:transcriptional regulator GlxA family with amidase domain